MITTLRRIGHGSIAVWMLISLQSARGSDMDAATRLYGQGVHAYFAGQPGEAELLLSRALGLEAGDPRMFYFRALSRLRLGRLDDAHSDMAIGSEIESRQLNRFAVGAALQRAQGSDRLLLEQYRQQARERATQASDQIEVERHQQISEQDSDVLRQRVVVPLDEYLRPGVPGAVSSDGPARPAAAAPRVPSPAPPSAAVPELTPAAPAEGPILHRAPQPIPETPPQPAPDPTPSVEASPESEEDPFRDLQ
jgi:hypothetical protein